MQEKAQDITEAQSMFFPPLKKGFSSWNKIQGNFHSISAEYFTLKLLTMFFFLISDYFYQSS